MKRILPAATFAFTTLGVGAALAGSRCQVPMADWQPREVLQEKVRSQGWSITRIKTDDGCYKVYGTNEKGQRIKAKFDPGTLEKIKEEIDRD